MGINGASFLDDYAEVALRRISLEGDVPDLFRVCVGSAVGISGLVIEQDPHLTKLWGRGSGNKARGFLGVWTGTLACHLLQDPTDRSDLILRLSEQVGTLFELGTTTVRLDLDAIDRQRALEADPSRSLTTDHRTTLLWFALLRSLGEKVPPLTRLRFPVQMTGIAETRFGAFVPSIGETIALRAALMAGLKAAFESFSTRR